jgi:hypothetical protein
VLEYAAAADRMMDSMEAPQFLCIGAHKSGTTWLYENLKQHPAVWLPPVKELHFFDGLPNMAKIARRLNDAIKAQLAANAVTDPVQLDFLRRFVLDQPKDIAWYRSLFRDAGGRTCGDITPAYAVLSAATVARVHAVLPMARIIFIMRDPIDRAWSHFRFNAGKQERSVESYAPADFIKHFDSAASESRTRYTRTIDVWESRYPRDNIHYLFYDDIRADPNGLLRSVCEFLGLEFKPDYFSTRRDRVARKSIELPISPEHQRYLARKYHDEIAALQQRFGGHADRWLARCRQLLNARDGRITPFADADG